MTKPLHPNNPHRERYDFAQLCASFTPLKAFVIANPKGDQTIDFANPEAVLCLNRALLAHYYRIRHWQIPAGYLCPPIPGRADYIYYVADLLAGGGEVPTGKNVKVLDIGTGANCIYPIIGSQKFGWRFWACDIDPVSIAAAESIVKANPSLTKRVKVLRQADKKSIFHGVIQPLSHFELTICNPPFYRSQAEADSANQRKRNNLAKTGKSAGAKQRNFGGQQAELWCEGGELAFVSQMIRESVDFAQQVGWFTTLISQQRNVAPLKRLLQQQQASQIKMIDMAQGQKVSRLLAWRF